MQGENEDQNQGTQSPESNAKLKHFAEILNPLFWHDDFNEAHRLFEYMCTLVRAGGLKDSGWDSYIESIALLTDLTNLMGLNLDAESGFGDWEATEVRLALIAYSHMVEMDFPYDLLVNLLRLRCGEQYCMHPFAHLGKPVYVKIHGTKYIDNVIKASPSKKIAEIKKWATRCDMPEIPDALSSFYDSVIRNAISHSDFAVHDGSLRLLSGTRYSASEKCRTPLVPFADIAELTNNAFGFHSALNILFKRQLTLLSDFRGKIMPFDDYYKGVIEYTFEDNQLAGFRVYWPNETIGVFHRQSDGACYAQNLRFNPNGSINFMVGVMASQRGAFSPLVEINEAPRYAEVPGHGKRPHWPDDLLPYAI
jgi:hypothetical protein